MDEWVWSRVTAIANVAVFVILLAVALLFIFLLFRPNHAAFAGEKTLDGRMVSASDVEPTLKTFATQGYLDRYALQEKLDFGFAVAYALLLAVAIAGLGRRTALPHWLVLLPFATALFDWCENALFLALIGRYRASQTVAPPLAMAASVASHLKWTFAMLAISATVITVVEWLRLAIRR